MSQARRMLQQALQESLDRRDNGGPAGLRDHRFRYDEEPGAGSAEVTSGSPVGSAGRVDNVGEPPVSVWAASQLQRSLT